LGKSARDTGDILSEGCFEFDNAKERGMRRRKTSLAHPTRVQRVVAKQIFQLHEKLEIVSSHEGEHALWFDEDDDTDFRWSDEVDADAKVDDIPQMEPWIEDAGHYHNERNTFPNFRDRFSNRIKLMSRDEEYDHKINARGLKLHSHRRPHPKKSTRIIHHFVAEPWSPLQARFYKEKKKKSSRTVDEEMRRARTNRIRGGNPVYWGKYFRRQGERLPLRTFRARLPWFSNQL
jgi:hypothetical protein